MNGPPIAVAFEIVGRLAMPALGTRTTRTYKFDLGKTLSLSARLHLEVGVGEDDGLLDANNLVEGDVPVAVGADALSEMASTTQRGPGVGILCGRQH